MKVVALPFTLLFVLIAVPLHEAKHFEKCELVHKLRSADMDGFAGYSLGNWICMAYHESKYDTNVVGPKNTDGSRDYGIFQINSRYWCTNGEGKSANGCNTSCNNFINDDIDDDIACAKRIVNDPQKMDAWVAWVKNCKGHDLKEWTEGC